MVEGVHNLILFIFVGLLVAAMGGVFYFMPKIDFTEAVVEEAFTFGLVGEASPAPQSVIEAAIKLEGEGQVLGEVDVIPEGYVGYPPLTIPKTPVSVFAPDGATL